MFTHEKFEAYRIAIEFTDIALQLMDDLPSGHAALRDQFKRAAFSVPLNIAEGTGKNSQSDRKRFYAIARGSAMECAAVCDIIALLDKKFAGKTEIGKQKLKSVVGILSTVCVGR
ncbi:MAG: four helix bundle protein [Bdellovibrionales bacterium]|nr:four helix bundle protein [Bdellovibrionales bacterium]